MMLKMLSADPHADRTKSWTSILTPAFATLDSSTSMDNVEYAPLTQSTTRWPRNATVLSDTPLTAVPASLLLLPLSDTTFQSLLQIARTLMLSSSPLWDVSAAKTTT